MINVLRQMFPETFCSAFNLHETYLFKILHIYESFFLVICQGALLPRQTKQMTKLPNSFLFPSSTKEMITVWFVHITGL